jgi:regulator of nucleoside diphosphate kinase
MNSTGQETIYSEVDAGRLRSAADAAAYMGTVDKRLIRILNHGLNHAQMVQPQAIPPDVVTMRSVIRVTDLTDNTVREISIHYPEEAEPLDGKISVLTPTGLALLGAREGEEVTLDTPGGLRRLRVEKIVYQPEARGEYTM